MVPYNASLMLSFLNSLMTSINVYPILMNQIWPVSQSNNVTISIYSFSKEEIIDANAVSGNQFPESFIFGAASSAYQVEGAYNIDKGPSVWDIYTHLPENKIVDYSNGDVADNSYEFYLKDVERVNQMSASAYKFSISWPRILPSGLLSKVNLEGVQYYNNLIDEIIAYNMTPVVCMYQFDYPYELYLMGGWTNPESIVWFTEYAKLLFQLFKDRVKYWVTFNKPQSMCSDGYGGIEKFVDEGTDDYLCGQNVLLAHANVYYFYKNNIQQDYPANIGISFNMDWYEPLSESQEDFDATLRAFVFKNEWLLSPLMTGDYPELMKEQVVEMSSLQGYEQSRLPALEEYGKFIKGKVDFIGIDYFTTIRTTSDNNSNIYSDQSVFQLTKKLGDVKALFVTFKNESLTRNTPENLGKMLRYLNLNYELPPVYITGNGFADDGKLDDIDRVNYVHHHLNQILQLMQDGIDIRGYFIWSLLDSFEYLQGYTAKYGIFQVDFNDQNRTRTPKLSSKVLTEIFGSKQLGKLDDLLHKYRSD